MTNNVLPQSSNVMFVANAAADWYTMGPLPRRYHNQSHAMSVVSNIMLLTGNRPTVPLVLAAYWHDAVYVPGAGGTANEDCSAAALIATAKARGCDDEDSQIIGIAAKLIRQTSVEHHLADDTLLGMYEPESMAILLDADLASLGTPSYEEFVCNQHNIILEHGGSPNEDFSGIASGVFLGKFLTCRDHIYHTSAGRELWGLQARHNITRWRLENGCT